jgi:hypothetical protein
MVRSDLRAVLTAPGLERRALEWARRMPVRSAAIAMVVLVAATAFLAVLVFGSEGVAGNVTAAAAIVALVVGGFTLLDQRRIHKLELTYSYVQRLNDPEMRTQLGFMRYIVASAPPERLDVAKWGKLDDAARQAAQVAWDAKPAEDRVRQRLDDWIRLDPETRNKAVAYPNFIEELAGMYNLGLLDRDAARLQFTEVPGAWELAAPFIERYREDMRDPEYYTQWERMKDDLIRRTA